MSKTLDKNGTPAPLNGLVLGRGGYWLCPACLASSGDYWQKCIEHNCPVKGTPNYNPNWIDEIPF